MAEKPKTGAQRKAEHDARQRALGRKPRTYWANDAEDRAMRAALIKERCKSEFKKEIEAADYAVGEILSARCP